LQRVLRLSSRLTVDGVRPMDATIRAQRATPGYASRNLAAFRKAQGTLGAPSLHRTYAAKFLENTLNSGMPFVKQAGYGSQ